MIHTGGCQCGYVRFRVEGVLPASSICHCRMCQKAYGNVFAAIVSTKGAQVTWTKGAPKYFRSSNHGSRGFCENCGTMLTYDAPDGLGLSVGAFDDPSALAPNQQYGVESKIAWVDHVSELPARRTEEDAETTPFLRSVISYQHPDHDTDDK